MFLPNTLPVTNPSLLSFFALICISLFSALKVFIYLFLQNLNRLAAFHFVLQTGIVKWFYIYFTVLIIALILKSERVIIHKNSGQKHVKN